MRLAAHLPGRNFRGCPSSARPHDAHGVDGVRLLPWRRPPSAVFGLREGIYLEAKRWDLAPTGPAEWSHRWPNVAHSSFRCICIDWNPAAQSWGCLRRVCEGEVHATLFEDARRRGLGGTDDARVDVLREVAYSGAPRQLFEKFVDILLLLRASPYK